MVSVSYHGYPPPRKSPVYDKQIIILEHIQIPTLLSRNVNVSIDDKPAFAQNVKTASCSVRSDDAYVNLPKFALI